MPVLSPPAHLVGVVLPLEPEAEMAERVRQLIKRRISDPALSVDGVAKDLGMACWKMQSLLNVEGETVSGIKEDVRKELAIKRVRDSSDTVPTIAESLGYTNSSNFTRAFRNWTGKSPRDYRKSS